MLEDAVVKIIEGVLLVFALVVFAGLFFYGAISPLVKVLIVLLMITLAKHLIASRKNQGTAPRRTSNVVSPRAVKADVKAEAAMNRMDREDIEFAKVFREAEQEAEMRREEWNK